MHIKTYTFFKNQKAFHRDYLPNKETIIILTGNMGINYGSYSYFLIILIASI